MFIIYDEITLRSFCKLQGHIRFYNKVIFIRSDSATHSDENYIIVNKVFTCLNLCEECSDSIDKYLYGNVCICKNSILITWKFINSRVGTFA